ncbi:MAG: polysaccharide biosynthesis/export family protein [Bacteroidetes bacterium]|nr:polysaccharide biosynthesis/export family protein [Bacteroidota bacterium]
MNLFNGKPFLILAVVFSLFSVSCVNTKKIAYFNNLQDTVLRDSGSAFEAVVQKNDLLSITVSSLNPEASYMFNLQNQASAPPSLTTAATGLPATTTSAAAGGMQQLGYLVGDDGSIKFPVIGNIQAAGLTKRQLEKSIAGILTEKKLLVDPIVSIRFLNFRVTVLGEVARPTTINVANERISILEAIGLAGDLTIFGKRENVLLVREEGDKKLVKRIDLNSGNILTSPYYYLKTNDVVYVEPNKTKIASTSRTQQLLPIILSGLSFIAIIVTYTLRHN